MILSLLFAFMADACSAKKGAAYYAKHGRHCCKKCKARAKQNILKPEKGHVAHSNGITRAVLGVKKHHIRKNRRIK
ncbi:MAG: hypothetical protein AAB323_01630 [Pseudomonadota bacterium]